jgi:peroxiredoxin
MARTASSQVLRTGQVAPDFLLKGVDNKIYSLNNFKSSKCLLVIFICNHCPYVKARISDIVDLRLKFDVSDLKLVAINSNDTDYQDEGFENMKIFANNYGLNFPYLIDDSQVTAKQYGAMCTPDPFLFDSERRLVFHGRINDAVEPDMTPNIPVMENNIKKILNKENLEKDFDPSIGCSIKWKMIS